ncbi:cytochrome P450 [Lentzea sp. BCCO 10_0061]|uniref:Cytochrome P450 n=1 Tax=Lentzea sokolovensis TaxID=3095429 RepID=A0ABU4UPE8_9PSEU|nr:cytochrome P450 [Lentzea sp. BCCO 10_0061]MDX8141367.1 cytochrome P450 [Lentzea sp. BCCO 10_0061]
MRNTTLDQLPSPAALPLLGHALSLLRDPFGFLTTLPPHGDLVRIRLGPFSAVVVCDPDLTRQVTLDDRTYDKGGALVDRAREMVGDGLIVCPRSQHRRLRRLTQPAFHHSKVPGYANTTAAHVAAASGRWKDGEVLDVTAQMLAALLDSVVEMLFSDTLPRETVQELIEDFTVMVRGMFRRTVLPPALTRLRTSGNRRYERHIARLHRTVDTIIAQRRTGPDHDDLLSVILSTLDTEQPGEAPTAGLSDGEVRDQILSFLFAGSETTAATVAWALHLLAEHPEIERQVQAEVDAVLAGGPADFSHLPDLDLTGRVVSETVRLYPSAWFMTRHATTDTTLGGHAIPAGTTVAISPYLIHHRADLYPAPDAFDPGRWKTTDPTDRKNTAYIPFSAGPRMCIGDGLGPAQVTLAVATVVARWRLSSVPGGTVRPDTAATLRPRKLLMTATRR